MEEVRQRPEAPAPKRATPSPASARLWLSFVLAFAAIPAVAVSSVMLLIMVGLLPTLSVWLTDRQAARQLSIAVGATNALGVFIVALDYLSRPQSLAAALATLADGRALLVMYGAAALGWVLRLGMPTVAAVLIAANDRSRRRALEEAQAALVARWGDEVRGSD